MDITMNDLLELMVLKNAAPPAGIKVSQLTVTINGTPGPDRDRTLLVVKGKAEDVVEAPIPNKIDLEV